MLFDVCIAYATLTCDQITSLYFRKTLSRATEIPSLSLICRKICNIFFFHVYMQLRNLGESKSISISPIYVTSLCNIFRIKVLPPLVFESLNSLETLSLQNNRLTHIPQDVTENIVDTLRHIDMTGNILTLLLLNIYTNIALFQSNIW